MGKAALRLVALAIEFGAKLTCFLVQRSIRYGCSVGFRSICADKIALDVDVADLAGGVAKLLEQAKRVAFLVFVRRKSGEQGEQFELRLCAARGGAQAVDRDFSRFLDAEPDRCFKRSYNFVEALDRVRGMRCVGHGTGVFGTLKDQEIVGASFGFQVGTKGCFGETTTRPSGAKSTLTMAGFSRKGDCVSLPK